MEKEIFQPRTLLKAKDGSGYMEFKYYVIGQKRSETPTDRFCGMTIYQDRVFRDVEDYRIADDAEQKIYRRLIELKSEAIDIYRECRIHNLKAKEDREELRNHLDFISNVYADINSVMDKIDKMENFINAVITYTGKDYVKGDSIKKDLKSIREDLAKLKKEAKPIYELLAKGKDQDNTKQVLSF